MKKRLPRWRLPVGKVGLWVIALRLAIFPTRIFGSFFSMKKEQDY
jgi:hypothetical protein